MTNHRRTLKDIQRYHNAADIYQMITQKTWPYSTAPENQKQTALLIKRDHALLALDFLGAFRNNEPIMKHPVKTADGKTITATNDRALRRNSFEETDAWLILHDAKISKRSKKVLAKNPRAGIRADLRFPKFSHPLQPFTYLILDYLAELEPNDILFKIGTRRHHQTVYHITGMWPHYFRAMGENWMGHNVYRSDALGLSQWVGTVSLDTVKGYIGIDEERYIENLKKAANTDRK